MGAVYVVPARGRHKWNILPLSKGIWAAASKKAAGSLAMDVRQCTDLNR